MKMLSLLLALIFATSNIGYAAKIEDDTLKIGKPGSSANKEIHLGNTRKIRSNAVSGKIEFTNDGTLYKNFGSGSGGGAGANSLIENGGFEDGIAVGWEATVATTATISGSSALIGTTSVSFNPAIQNEYLRTSYFTVVKGLRGAACEARFMYTGAGVNVYAKVETESGVILGMFQRPLAGVIEYGLPTHSASGYESVYFKCPTEADITALSTNGNIRLVIYQGTAVDAAIGVYDDVHFGGLIGLTEVTTLDVLSARVAATGSSITSSSSPGWITSTNGATGLYTLNWAGLGLTNAPSCTFSAIVAPSANEMRVCADQNNTITNTGVTLRCSGSGGTNANTEFSVICQKQDADAKQSVQVYKSIPKIDQNINEFSASVSNAGTVSGENVDWINGNCSMAGGISACNFNSGVFNIAPTCFANFDASVSNASQSASSFGATTSAVSTRILSGGGALNGPYTLLCRKSLTDFSLPTVQPVIIGQVTNSAAESGLVNVRTESCRVNNSGSASIDAASGLCEGWIQSVSRTALGLITYTIKSGIFSAPPVCNATCSDGGASQCATTLAAASSTVVTTATHLVNTGNQDRVVYLTCKGKR